MSNGHVFLALGLLQSKGCCETSPSSSGGSLSFLPFIQHGLNKETSAATPQQTSPNQGKINMSIWDVYGGVGCQGALWELGAKSLELQIRAGKDSTEPGPGNMCCRTASHGNTHRKGHAEAQKGPLGTMKMLRMDLHHRGMEKSLIRQRNLWCVEWTRAGITLEFRISSHMWELSEAALCNLYISLCI